MRSFRFLNLAIGLVLVGTVLGTTALVYAQDEKQQEEKPARQEEAKPQPKQDEARPSRPEEAKPSKQEPRQQEARPEEKRGQEQSHEQATPDRQERPEMQGNRERQGQERPEMQGNHAQGKEYSGQRAENGRPAGKGGHIPDDKFRTHFGREHHFSARTVIVAGQPRFQYGGYNFELVDAWPADWAYTDDCYIDYIDGEYFLFDVLHPGIRIAVFVVM